MLEVAEPPDDGRDDLDVLAHDGEVQRRLPVDPGVHLLPHDRLGVGVRPAVQQLYAQPLEAVFGRQVKRGLSQGVGAVKVGALRG